MTYTILSPITPYRVRRVHGYVNDVDEYTRQPKRTRGQTNRFVTGWAVMSQNLILAGKVYATRAEAVQERDTANKFLGINP